LLIASRRTLSPLGPDSLNIDRAISRIHIGGQDDQKF
jgi:hypothetical protein